MPFGSGYLVKLQMKGEDATGGLQFKITATQSVPSRPANLAFITLTGRRIHVQTRLDDRVIAVKRITQNLEGMPPDQQGFVHTEKDLEGSMPSLAALKANRHRYEHLRILRCT